MAAAAVQRVGSSPTDVFEGLRDVRNLQRERALEALHDAVASGRFSPEDVEPLVFEALGAEAWEARHGGLLASAEMIDAWDRAEFRARLLDWVPRLLLDKEYRVRKALSMALGACCRREGLAIYDKMEAVVLGDIRDKFRRCEEVSAESGSQDKDDALAPPTFLHDTEGWRSLETSMSCLEAMMQGCGAAFTPRISAEMLDMLAECSRHTNRFVREYAQFSFRNVFEVCELEAFLATVGPRCVEIISAGIRDNWSQVRYAASTATRAFMQKAGEHRERFYPELLGSMCLNRHYVAEGVRLFSQETWRFVCGPQGGARLLVAHFDAVLDTFVEAAEAPNHAVREASCHCISELAARVAGTPLAPTPHREHFTHVRIQRLLQTLLQAFQDESWPVRDCASSALGHFVRAFPEECESFRDQLVDLWFDQMADNVPSMRRNGAVALAMAARVWMDEVWDNVFVRLTKTLPEVLMQPENSQIFTDYTPSGPFSVPRRKPMSFGDQAEPEVVNQTLYSCGSYAPKTFKRKRAAAAAAGCMNCNETQPHQLWEGTEGMVHLLAEMAAAVAQNPNDRSPQRLDSLASQMPMLAQGFRCSQFRHHYNLKQRICERLPDLTMALGPERVRPHLPDFLPTITECTRQQAHPALREVALEVLQAWKRAYPSQGGQAEDGSDPAGP